MMAVDRGWAPGSLCRKGPLGCSGPAAQLRKCMPISPSFGFFTEYIVYLLTNLLFVCIEEVKLGH